MKPPQLPRTRVWKLPPLILHPFTDSSGPERLMESSKAHLILQGMLPAGDQSKTDLEQRLLAGRLYELRMLYYLGKDLERWAQQCVDFAMRDNVLAELNATELSFFSLLIEAPPTPVQQKLKAWGVVDSKTIFMRASGLRSVFADAPTRALVTDEFVRNYFRYADQFFLCRVESTEFPTLPAGQFHFDLYASGEYARILERQWEAGAAFDSQP